MRKENAAVKRKFTLQVQDLRRQLVTKKAFDEDVSQREISRLKKELAFVNMQLYNNKRQEFQKEAAGPPGGSDGQLKIAQAMQDQKKALESENENLRQRIGQLEVDQDITYQDRSQKGAALMNNYMDEMGDKSYLSSEIM